METDKVEPLPKETIKLFDREIAKVGVAGILSQIPEFNTLWVSVRSDQSKVMESLRPLFLEYSKALTPDGRGALAAITGGVFNLYEKAAQDEAMKAWRVINLPNIVTYKGKFVWEEYSTQLENLVRPLGVPDLALTLMAMDADRWGMTNLLYESGSIEGPIREILESKAVTFLTDLSPVKLVTQTHGRIRRRVRRKFSPMSRHLQRYDLKGRIRLWVLNVVYGMTYEEIATILQNDEQRVSTGESPYAWVREQVRDVNALLGVKRKGRPPKGGVLRQWKLMAE